MWIKKDEYDYLKAKERKLEEYKIEFANEMAIKEQMLLSEKKKCFNESEKLYKIRKDLEYYLDTHEECGVVYIPKFVIKRIVYGNKDI